MYLFEDYQRQEIPVIFEDKTTSPDLTSEPDRRELHALERLCAERLSIQRENNNGIVQKPSSKVDPFRNKRSYRVPMAV